MDILTNKKFQPYDYNSRYSTTPYFFNTVDQREIYGIGQRISQDLPYTLHTIGPRQTLDSLALRYYGNPTFWWVIAYFNNIQDALAPIINTYATLKIPTISKVTFGGNRT